MYFITLINEDEPFKTSRCFGYQPELWMAQQVSQNLDDESYYDFLVIEKIPNGIHPTVEREIWYKWKDKWMEIEKPLWSSGITNWAIG